MDKKIELFCNFNFFFCFEGRVNIPTDSGAREIAAICDTALLQALLLTGQIVVVLELLKGFNYCDKKI